MNLNPTVSLNFFLLAFALTFYCVGASFVEGFVNYRTWPLIGPAEFKAYHQALSPKIIATLVVPAALQFLMSILLLWLRPAIFSTWAIIPLIIFGVIIWTSTVFIQIPIQVQLSSGQSLELIERLILTDWIRKVSLTASAFWYLWLMAKVLNRADFRNWDFAAAAEEK